MKTMKEATKEKGNQKPCVWWHAGLMPRQACESREDCVGCPVETNLEKLVSSRQRDFFPKDFFDMCSVHACAIGERSCPFVAKCISNWSRTGRSASRVLTLMGFGGLSIGVNASLIQQFSRRRGLYVDLITKLAELRESGRLGPKGLLTPEDLGLTTVKQQFSTVAAAAFVDCLEPLDLTSFTETLYEKGLSRYGLPDSVLGERSEAELWEAFWALAGLGALEVLSAFDVDVLVKLQQVLGSTRYPSMALAHMALAVQRFIQPITQRPIKQEESTLETAATLVGFADGLLRKPYQRRMVTPAEIGASLIIGRIAQVVTDDGAIHAGKVLIAELVQAAGDNIFDVSQAQLVLAGIVASGQAITPQEHSLVATAVWRSFQERFQKVGDLAKDPDALLAHLGADNLVHESDRFAALATVDAPIDALVPEVDLALLGCTMPVDLFYHANHTWVRPESDGAVRIGLDDVAARLVGQLDAVRLPSHGEPVRQGRPVLRLIRGGESVDVVSPVDGEVQVINQAVVDLPAAMARKPYDDGWLILIRPREIGRSLSRLKFGKAARSWQIAELDRLRTIFRGSAFATAADGGVLEPDILANAPGIGWSKVLKKFLNG